MTASEVPQSEAGRLRRCGGLDGFFKFTERGTNMGTEVRAGLTTFLVMAYIIFLNPLILSNMFPEDSPERMPSSRPPARPRRSWRAS